MEMSFIYIVDPGHGWLEVPLLLLKQLEIDDKISTYSYMQSDKAYLEEDCDMSIFLDKAEREGHKVSYQKVYQENTPVRNMAAYKSDWYKQSVTGYRE